MLFGPPAVLDVDVVQGPGCRVVKRFDLGGGDEIVCIKEPAEDEQDVLRELHEVVL